MKTKKQIEAIKAELAAKYESNIEFYIEETDTEIIAYGYDTDFGVHTRLESVSK
jgi:hypothetical protein